MKNEFDYFNDVKMDFSLYNEESISEEEINYMKNSIKNKRKSTKIKKISVIAACAAAVAIMGTVFASDYINDIIKTVSTGYNSFVQTDPTAPQELPAELIGKLFDRDGNPLQSISKADFDNLYDENGSKIDGHKFAEIYENAFGTDVKIQLENEENEIKDSQKFYDTIEIAQSEAAFDIKVPEYIPSGYSLAEIYTYKNSDGSSSGEYMNLEYKNEKGKRIVIFERILNEQTKFTASTDGDMEELKIGGQTAVLMDGKSIDWETEDNVSVGIASMGNISKDELIKMAESVK